MKAQMILMIMMMMLNGGNDTLDDETGDFIYQAADQLGLEDFWFEDGGYEGAHTPTIGSSAFGGNHT